MKLTYCDGFFPFYVPEMDDSFAASVGSRTEYPAGFSLDQAMQIYWRAREFHLTATGSGVLGALTQSLGADSAVPGRNYLATNEGYGLLDGLVVRGPGDLLGGRGTSQIVAGTGTVAASGDGVSGTNSAAVLNLQVNLFVPLSDDSMSPLVKYDGRWWPLMSVSCATTNTVELDSGGSLSMGFDCTTVPDSASTVSIGAMSFFGVSVPVYCTPLAPASGPDAAETRSFTSALTVGLEWA